MNLTEIWFYKNTPFTDFQNTIHFKSDDERDAFFDKHYTPEVIETDFNMIKDRLTIHTKLTTLQTYGVNYCRFKNAFDGRWYYAFVMYSQYINNGVTEVGLVLDTVMTFLQGDFTTRLGVNLFVKRQSLTEHDWIANKQWLAHNDDLLVFPKRYTAQKLDKWSAELYVIFTSSVDLTADPGSSINPKMTTSNGQTYDGIVSPQDLYLCKTQNDFTWVMKTLKNYPWIAQNISNVAIVPGFLVDDNDIQPIKDAKLDGINTYCWHLHDGAHTASTRRNLLTSEWPNIKKNMKMVEGAPIWLYREQYASIELTAWNGQAIDIDPSFLPADGLHVYAQNTFGYHNEIKIIPDQYKDAGENTIAGIFRGTYANNALIFDTFDDIPILIDNYKLYKAQTAHTRELGNERTISGRINQIISPNTSLQDKFFNAASIVSNGLSVKGAASEFTDEYEHYRTQRAELADKAIAAPSVGAQNNSQSFNIGHGIYGVTERFQSIGVANSKQVLRYHNTFGFDFGEQVAAIYSIETMPLMNFLSFDGNWNLPDVPAQFMQQLKVTMENGVKFWHNNGTDNPFTQSIVNNFAQ